MSLGEYDDESREFQELSGEECASVQMPGTSDRISRRMVELVEAEPPRAAA